MLVGVAVLVDVVQEVDLLDGLVEEVLVVLDPLDAHQPRVRGVLALVRRPGKDAKRCFP